MKAEAKGLRGSSAVAGDLTYMQRLADYRPESPCKDNT